MHVCALFYTSRTPSHVTNSTMLKLMGSKILVGSTSMLPDHLVCSHKLFSTVLVMRFLMELSLLLCTMVGNIMMECVVLVQRLFVHRT